MVYIKSIYIYTNNAMIICIKIDIYTDIYKDIMYIYSNSNSNNEYNINCIFVNDDIFFILSL